MRQKLSFEKVLLEAENSEERQLYDRGTAYTYTARIAKGSYVGIVEMFYAEMRVMIDIPTEEKIYRDFLATKKIMPEEPKEHMKDIAQESHDKH